MNESTLREAALWYAEHGWPVLPLHSIRGDVCTCRRSDCSSPGKHPRTRRGLKDASCVPAAVGDWWRVWPDANVGITTGRNSGIIVLDIDPRHAGDTSLAELAREYGALPPTAEAMTGGGGRHLVFAHSGYEVKNRTGIRPGIDLRGDNGYIVVAPSDHVSGGSYRWRPGHGPDELQPAPMPTWLLTLLIERPAAEHPKNPLPSHEGNGHELARLMAAATRYVLRVEAAAEGNRNTAAFNLAGHLFAFQTDASSLRLTAPQVLDLLRPWNHRNTPPLDEAELARVVDSAGTNGVPRGTHKVRGGADATRPELDRAPAGILPVVPFPVDALPEPARSFVTKAARALGCDPSFVALPLLAALASAIGNTRRIQLKRGWTEPAIVWAVIVGDSGTLKSPALELALRPIRKRQREAMKRHAREMEQYTLELALYERELTRWKRCKDGSDPPTKPTEPVPDRCYCDDVTIEALAGLLVNQPRGLLLVRDELAGWLGGFDRYAQGKGGDAPKWLEVFGGRPVMVDRKSGTPRTIYIPQAAVSVCGGIQPETLRRALGTEHRENGLAARLLAACPPRRPKRWTEADIDARTEAAIDDVFRRLFDLKLDTDDDGEPRPRLVTMTPAAKAVWVDFYNAHATEHADLMGELSAVWSKLEGYAARLALVVHFVRWAAEDATLASSDAVDEVSIAAGVTLSRWFGHEARRVYALLRETDDERDRRHLLELIDRMGGAVTPRELRQRSRRYQTASDAKAALAELVKVGAGLWEDREPTAKGGRPARVFRLIDGNGRLRNPRCQGRAGGFVDVDGADASLSDDGAAVGGNLGGLPGWGGEVE